MTRAYTHDELRQLLPGIECAAHSGGGIGPETALRLAATVRDLQRELLTSTQRAAESQRSDAAAMEGLCARVRELEGHLNAVCDEHLLQCDSRKPRPALVEAQRYLFPGQARAVVESRVAVEPAAVGRGAR